MHQARNTEYKITVEPSVERLYFKAGWIDRQLEKGRPVWTRTLNDLLTVSVTGSTVKNGELWLATDRGPMLGSNSRLQAMERDSDGYWIAVAYEDSPEREDYYHDPKTIVEMQDWLMSIED